MFKHNEDSIPVYQCVSEVIENCDNQEDFNCTVCADGYWRKYNEDGYDVCMECDIERCLTCDPSDDWTYPTCTSCEDELHLAEVFLDHDTLYSRCEWDDSDLMIENCDFVSPIDRSVCETCFDGYIWDEIEKVCTYCSDFI